MTQRLEDLIPGKRYADNNGLEFVYLVSGRDRTNGAAEYDNVGLGLSIIGNINGPFTPISEKRTVVGWVNVYRGLGGLTVANTIYRSEAAAISDRGEGGIDTVIISFEEPEE